MFFFSSWYGISVAELELYDKRTQLAEAIFLFFDLRGEHLDIQLDSAQVFGVAHFSFSWHFGTM